MEEQTNARLTSQASSGPLSAPGSLSEADLAAFARWRAEQLGQQVAGAPPAVVPAVATLPDEAYSARVGELIVQSGAPGEFAIVVGRGPFVDSVGTVTAGYKIVSLGTANDVAQPLEVLGYQAL